jgi:hypothetical protein
VAITIDDLYKRLGVLDEITVLELLEINSEELVTAFWYKVEDKADFLIAELEDEEEQDC